MKTEILPEPDHKTLAKYFSGFMLIIMICFSAEIVQGQIVFSDTREQTKKAEMMQMFLEANLILDSFVIYAYFEHILRIFCTYFAHILSFFLYFFVCVEEIEAQEAPYLSVDLLMHRRNEMLCTFFRAFFF